MSDIVILDLGEAESEAFGMGCQEFDGVDVDDCDQIIDFDAGSITDSARYANIILPCLRALAGMGDDGTGCYTEDREVAVIPPEARGDLPADGFTTNADYLVSRLVDAFFEGAYLSVEEAFEEKELRIEMTGQ